LATRIALASPSGIIDTVTPAASDKSDPAASMFSVTMNRAMSDFRLKPAGPAAEAFHQRQGPGSMPTMLVNDLLRDILLVHHILLVRQILASGAES
jgi:hypothetical protein